MVPEVVDQVLERGGGPFVEPLGRLGSRRQKTHEGLCLCGELGATLEKGDQAWIHLDEEVPRHRIEGEQTPFPDQGMLKKEAVQGQPCREPLLDDLLQEPWGDPSQAVIILEIGVHTGEPGVDAGPETDQHDLGLPRLQAEEVAEQCQ